MRATTRKLHNNMYIIEDECGRRISSVSGRRADKLAERIAELFNSGQVRNEMELAGRILGANKA